MTATTLLPPKRTARKLFEVRKSLIQGRGVFAAQHIPAGTRIIEYVGERIAPDEADRRYDDDVMERHHTFLFIVNDDVVVDAAHDGNEARFINHPCEPNCEAVVEDDRIFIDALRDIEPGEELTYDYSYERAGRYQAHYDRLYACHCGAPGCRGTILMKPRKPAPRKRARGARSAKRSGAKKTKR